MTRWSRPRPRSPTIVVVIVVVIIVVIVIDRGELVIHDADEGCKIADEAGCAVAVAGACGAFAGARIGTELAGEDIFVADVSGAAVVVFAAEFSGQIVVVARCVVGVACGVVVTPVGVRAQMEVAP